MNSPHATIKILTLALLLLQLWLPLYRTSHFTGDFAATAAAHASAACLHVQSAAGDEPGEDHHHATLCPELDPPCEAATRFNFAPRSLHPPLTVNDRGILRRGHAPPLDIPPEPGAASLYPMALHNEPDSTSSYLGGNYNETLEPI